MKTQLLKTLQNSRNYTIEVAKAMPEKSYSYKPTEAVWNFKELMDHIAYGIQWWETNFVKGSPSEWNPPAGTSSKQNAIDSLQKAYDALENTVKFHPLTDNVVKGFYATLDHITHHRAQAITYLRCQDITPPEYIY